MNRLARSVHVVEPPRDPVRALARWAATHCPPGGRVLDVGAGEHASGPLAPLTRRSAVLVGVDPDRAIEHNLALAERHRTTLEAFAPSHAGEFDVVLSIFVLEHVEHPDEFAAACATVLRPGGSWFALTLNAHHYFGATARLAERAGVQPWLLRRLTGGAGEHVHRFPTVYRLNSRRRVEAACARAGFRRLEFRVYDAPGRYAWYLPTALQRLPSWYSALAYRVGEPALMGHLSFRASVPVVAAVRPGDRSRMPLR